jgi:hypothetical protein
VKFKRNPKLYFGLILLGLFTMLSFQNCGQFDLVTKSSSESFSSSLDVVLRPPTDYAWHRRFVFLVDMSYSMVSGPCPFDVNVSEETHGFVQSQNPYKDFDPNFPQENVNFADARARVADCSVDKSLTFGEMKLDLSQPNNSAYLPNHKTFKGHDIDGSRFKIIKEWLRQMRTSSNQEFLKRTQVLIVPAAGGVAYERLLQNYPQRNMAFIDINNPVLDASIDYLETVHRKTVDMALLPPQIRFRDHDPDLDNLQMGTTSLNSAYENIFTIVDKEMERLASSNFLTTSTFKMINLGDQRTLPLDFHFTKALSYFNACSQCRPSLEAAWGKQQDDALETLDLKLSLIQGLSKYYGSGFFDLDFFEMRSLDTSDPIRYMASVGASTKIGGEDPLNQKDVLKFLDQRSATRKGSTRIFKIGSELPPYRIANNTSGQTNFKTTHVFLLNSNFKVDNNGVGEVDSDGDGLTDVDENRHELDPLIARTNGVCIDSLMIEPGFKSRCESLYSSRLCDIKLDSDGDSLNECEELTIGTDPFDFDTDGDGAPDSIEVLYQLNPLYDDHKADSNGDSLINIMNLGLGLNPSTLPSQVNSKDLIKIILNQIGQEESYSELIGAVRTDIFTLDLANFPLRKSNLMPEPATALYLLRQGSKGFSVASQIPPEQQLFKPITIKGTNKLTGILRIVDPAEPQRVYWEIFELPLDTKVDQFVSKIDLSLFKQMRVIDRVRLSK